ncbi:30S ribosome-binding factor RbfA [Lysobacter sp. HDW10]|jgi:ribosome-binding factor A|uniref:30S ribosome-binding factor RbfA n=1 Tax=Lysobacter sp. HDW10 TaxID=2714936 RepID=UPI00140D5B1F|nr:30S ribosome-binding factor RbfA [Lysobacter sp. HDW10]QIK81626.1 30S ribosome-binding factor RbfA [Lysobacter sp. HDW10]
MVGRKSFHRSDRVAAQLRRDVGTLVHNAMREYGLPSVSVSDVEVTRDLAHAKVFVTAFEKDSALETLKALQQLSKELRKSLAHMMKLRHVPELHFFYDESLDRGEHIETLLKQLPTADLSEEDEGTADGDDTSH